jgi:hypothetical protein
MTVANILYFNSSKNVGTYLTDSLCVYFGENSGRDVLSFYSALEYGLKSCDTLPDCMIILCSFDQMNSVEQFWLDSDRKNNFLNRSIKNGTKYTKEFYFVALKATKSEINKNISASNGLVQINESDVSNIFTKGLQNLINRNSVLHYAPAGHTFKHPSGKKSKLFIQTRELANSEVELQFIARAICLFVNQFNWQECDVIYIDTMGIYPFVKQALIFLGSSAEIRSFHSYDSLDTVSRPLCKSAVIISASTSGSMAKILCNKGWEARNIITLIDTHNRKGVSRVLINLSKSANDVELSDIDGSEADIDLVGEHFSYRAKPAKQITLGVPHTPKYLEDILEIFKSTGVNQLNSSTNSKLQLLSLNPSSLLNDKNFNEWMETELNWSLPLSVNCIVHPNDEDSKLLALRAKAIITKFCAQTVNVISSVELDAQKIKDVTGVLVLSTFAGDGGVFRQISRDLREYENTPIPRHFLAGIGIPQSMGSWERLNQFLIRNATQRFYKFSAWKVLPIGPDSIADFWNQLLSLAAAAQTIVIEPKLELQENVVNESLEKLAEVIAASKNSLLPTNSGEQLQITDGFVFFGKIYEDEEITNVPQSDVLLTVSAVMQAAREHKNPNQCLKPTNYQSVIIAPETFLRFNDDILQACILRACLASELDYSSDKHASEIMSEFIFKVFVRHEHSFGYAALEFGAALSTGKLKLKKEHTDELINKTITKLSSESSALLGFILMCKH